MRGQFAGIFCCGILCVVLFAGCSDDDDGGSSNSGGNSVPTAQSGIAVELSEDSTADITLRGNDADGDALSYAIYQSPAHGVLTLSGATAIYTPESNYHGTDSFAFTVSDGGAISSPATVALTIVSVNDAPVAATGLEASGPKNSAIEVALSGSDVDGDSLIYAVDAQPSHGSVVLAGATATYTPDADYQGPDSFDFTVSDGSLSSAVATVDLTVTRENDAPVADAGLTGVGDEDGTITVVLSGTDGDGDALSYAVEDEPAYGTLDLTGATATYTPDADFNGADSFSFTVSDGLATSDPATVALTVNPVNDAPVITSSASASMVENSDVVLMLVATDVDGDSVGFSVVGGADAGLFVVDGSQLRFVAAPDFESPADTDGDNTYNLILRADDGTATIDQAIAVSVIDSLHELVMVSLDGGGFAMGDSDDVGDDDERPVHNVTLSAFHISAHEVTNAQYAAVMNWAIGQLVVTASEESVTYAGTQLLDLDSSYCEISWDGSELVVDSDRGQYPVVAVTWHGAQAFCALVNQHEGLEAAVDLTDWAIDQDAVGYRLPTEAEWEYAARGGLSGASYPWGDAAADALRANYDYDENVGDRRPVGSYAANGYGLYDTAGNAWEWCADWYASAYYGYTPTEDPAGPASGNYRVSRGGGWYHTADAMRCANRQPFAPGYSGISCVGFRPVRGAGIPSGDG